MSHEIRTPLTGLVGMVNLLSDTSLSTEQSELTALISRLADSLLSLVNDILDFSKIEEGKLEMEKRTFDLHDMLKQLSEIFQFQMSENSLTYIIELSPNTPRFVIGDRTRLFQVLANLVGNSFKFTSAGGAIIVQVWHETVAENKLILHFAISDTGIGIPKEKLSSIFDKFSQADSSTTRKYGGTGLGLAIVKKLVLLMSGEVSFQSRENVGSCFTFYIQVEPALEPESLNKNLPNYPSTATESIEILVTEDNPVNQNCSNQKFKIILMDVQMPVLDGLEATRLIRTTCGEWGRRIPIIGLSAHAFRDAAERSTQQGMTDYLTKPFRATDLQERIEKALGTYQETQELN
jgi:hypothetical protein